MGGPGGHRHGPQVLQVIGPPLGQISGSATVFSGWLRFHEHVCIENNSKSIGTSGADLYILEKFDIFLFLAFYLPL